MNYDELTKKYNNALIHISKLEEENKILRSELGHDSKQLPPTEPDRKAPIKEVILVHEATETYNNVDDASSNKKKLNYIFLYLEAVRMYVLKGG